MSEVIKKGVYVPVQERPTKYTREYENNDGTISIWRYDSSKTTNGPVSVTITYPADFTVKEEVKEVKEVKKGKVPKYKQTFLNPKTGKMIGYARAKNLKLI